MKKLLSIITVLVIAISMTLVGCGKSKIVIKENDEYIVIHAEENVSNISLTDYMKKLEVDFEIEGGFVNSVNGIKNKSDYSKCWMLYTDDEENSNDDYGTVEYKGKVYGQSNLGADALQVKGGKTYIWIYQSFEF